MQINAAFINSTDVMVKWMVVLMVLTKMDVTVLLATLTVLMGSASITLNFAIEIRIVTMVKTNSGVVSKMFV